MNLSTLFLVCLLIVSCMTLHQQQTSIGEYDEKAELAQLTKQQEQFETQLTAMQSDLTRVTDSLKSSETDEQKVGILEDVVTRHRELIFQSSKTLIPAFNVAKSTCQELSA